MFRNITLIQRLSQRLDTKIIKCLTANISFDKLDKANKDANKIQFSKVPLLNQTNSLVYQQLRFKKTTKKGKNTNKVEEEEDESDEEYEDAEEDDDHDIKSIDTSNFQPGFKIVKKHVASLRFDSILSAGLNISRNKVDDYFYSSKLRLNGDKVLKKSSHVTDLDRLDLIGETDEKSGKRTLKRVVLYKVYEAKNKSKNKPKVILITWKSGLFEEDAYKSLHLE